MKTILTEKNLGYLNVLRKKKKIVLCHGVFDILHYGHITHFNMAKKFGEILVVSITEDAFVNKGPDRPIFPSLIRAKTILNLEIVDFVIISKSPNAIGVLKKIKPNFYVKDKEYQSKDSIFFKNFILEKNFLKKINCRIKFTNQIKYSSSNLVSLKFNNFDHLVEFNKNVYHAIFEKGFKLTGWKRKLIDRMLEIGRQRKANMIEIKVVS